MNPSLDVILRLVWTQCWQLTLVIVVVALLVKLACRHRPHLAYVLWMVVLLKALTPPLWSSPTGVFSWLAPNTEVVASIEPLGDRVAGPVAAAPVDTPDRSMSVSQNNPARDESAHTGQPTSSVRPAANIGDAVVVSTSTSVAMSPQVIAVTLIGIVWLAGVFVYAGYAMLTVIACLRITRRYQIPVEPPLAALTARLSQRLGIRQQVRLSVVDGPVGPLTLGWVRPTIVIPHALVQGQTIDELEPILAHELIHVRRRDGLVGFVQVLVQGIWWFHPLVWLVNRHICHDRERCCDEGVISEFAYEPRRYGQSLLGTLELKQQMRLSPAIPGVHSFEVTRRRLEYLLTHAKHFRRRMPRGYWLVLCLGILLVTPGAGLAPSANHSTAVAAPPASPQTADTPEAATPAADTPAPAEGWSLTGRVVDHRGAPVADAEVLLLGHERIFVDGNRRSWFVLRTEKGQLPKPPSARTDANGEFSIARSGEVVNRVAVIAPDPLLWVVSRESINSASDAEIKLPPSGSLAIVCDLPGKPAKQGVNIQLRTFDGINWKSDVVRYHLGDSFAKNPGETVFEHLPPGRYAVERNQMTKTGKASQLMSLADRQLVDVTSDERATVQFDRKIGRPLTGKVLGLEDADLRHAHVSINYWGPGEKRNKNKKPVRQMTTFDVIPITSAGDFTTDPIPPGDYDLHLTAYRTTTSNQSPVQTDFTAMHNFTIPAAGEMPTIEVTAKPRNKPDDSDAEETAPLRVVDEDGESIPRFELKVWTANRGSSMWLIGSKGKIAQNRPLWGHGDAEAVDVTVRAAGYASTLKHFAGAEREKLLRGEATLVMHRGEEVQVQFRLPAGMTWPEGLEPELYFEDLASDVRILWQPSNQRGYAESGMPDYNMLGARTEKPGTTTLRVSHDTPPFHVAINSPGFLRLFERGPFTLADVENGKLDIEVDAPATLNVQFDPSSTPAEELPFDTATISVLWNLPGGSGSYITVEPTADTDLQKQLILTDLAAGDYRVSVRTTAKPDVEDVSGSQWSAINPGKFFAMQHVALKAGQHERVDLRYTPFDADAFRGDRAAVVRVLKSDGSPAAGQEVTITYYDGHYGGLEVFAGNVPASGEIALADITDRRIGRTDIEPYGVTFNDRQIGRFGFTTGDATPEFTFSVPPAVGDMAPDVDLLNLATGSQTSLSSLRGKVVCLEFWASWCGPCREPLNKLNQLAADKSDAWKDKVAIVPISIDDTSDAAADDVTRRGLGNLEFYWTGETDATGHDSPAARAFVVGGVPTSLVIDRDGRILWRGHPSDATDGKDLAGRIEAALEQ